MKKPNLFQLAVALLCLPTGAYANDMMGLAIVIMMIPEAVVSLLVVLALHFFIVRNPEVKWLRILLLLFICVATAWGYWEAYLSVCYIYMETVPAYSYLAVFTLYLGAAVYVLRRYIPAFGARVARTAVLLAIWGGLSIGGFWLLYVFASYTGALRYIVA